MLKSKRVTFYEVRIPTEPVALRPERDGVYHGVRVRMPAGARGVDSALAHRRGPRRVRAPPQRTQDLQQLAQLAEERGAGRARLILGDAASHAGPRGCGGVYLVTRTVAVTVLVTCRPRAEARTLGASARAGVFTPEGCCDKDRLGAA